MNIEELFNIVKKNITITPELVERVLSLPTFSPSITTRQSNRGGVRADKFHNTESWGIELKKQIELIAEAKTRRLWVNINGNGHWNDWHSHEHARYACVFYLQTPKNSGDIIFRKDGVEYAITPYPGLMLIFPGTLEHKVTVNDSNDLRVSIAANLDKLITLS